MSGFEYDVFVSYVRKSVSGEQTNQLINRLRETVNPDREPSRIFVDHEMDGGKPFFQRLKDAIDSSRHFLALITAEYFHRDFCIWEFQHAFIRDPSSRNGFIVPVVLEIGAERSIPSEFSQIQLTNVRLKDHFERLCR